MRGMDALPIDDCLPDLRQSLAAGGNLLLQAPPGAGKTTRVPIALLAESWLAGQRILMLEPRRLAARNAAVFMARQLGEPVGATVGYRVRLDSRVSKDTRVEVVTEAILTRMLQDDPALTGVGLVIFDEFHERHLHTDLGLALCLDSQCGLREDLRILVMSATLDCAGVAALLAASTLTSAGRAHPVAVHYRPGGDLRQLPGAMTAVIREVLAAHPGDVLAFLPGAAEIRRTAEALADQVSADVEVHPLLGELSQADQDRALQPAPAGRRKVVLATAIAESSLTIAGVRTVVDGGWSRVPRFDPATGLTRLTTQRVAEDAATQRAGRAGREAPGQCYRLWPAGEVLRARTDPEIRQADLAGLLLELACWGVRDPADLAWLDPPAAGAVAQARQLLIGLDALDAAGLVTPLGRAMARLPVHPRLAHMLLRAHDLGYGALACDLAALLGERDIFRGEAGRRVDLWPRIEALRASRRDGRRVAQARGADVAACANVARVAEQMRGLLGVTRDTLDSGDEHDLGTLLALAYPDRVARLRAGSASRYLLSSGRGARIPEHDDLCGSPWLVAAHLDAGTDEGRIFLAARADYAAPAAELAPHVTTAERVAWDEASQSVRAVRETRFGALVIETRELREVDPAARHAALLEGIHRAGIEALRWDEAARNLQARLLSLHAWLPEEGWPAPSDAWLAEHLDAWLGPYLYGQSRLDAVRRLDLSEPLLGLLDARQRRAVDTLAPTHLEVPSGSRLRLDYASDGSAPVLAVKLQEMFGLAETPRVAGGRMPVTLHLLSPARRPIQVTQDLRGFWDRTYAEVKKELKGRYPKHPWPDDPWNAVATARTQRGMRKS